MQRMTIAGAFAAVALLLSGGPLNGTSLNPAETAPGCTWCSSDYSQAGNGQWYAYVEWGGACLPGDDCRLCNKGDTGGGCDGGDYEATDLGSEEAANLVAALFCNGCTTEGDLFADLPSLVTNNDTDAIAAVIERSGGKIFVNLGRGAIQGIGCGDKITYHLKASAALLDAVTSRLNTTPARGQD